MATWARMAIFFQVTLLSAITGIIYYRVGVAELFPRATGQHSGPFSPVIGNVQLIVPVVLVAAIMGTGLWALAGGVQKERARVGGRR